MFHNPFNSKVVADITKFLNEHRNDIDINPCLDEHAENAAEAISGKVVLEERRNILTTLFNEAITDCGCRGTNKEATDFAKAVDKYTNVAEANKDFYNYRLVVAGKVVAKGSERAMMQRAKKHGGLSKGGVEILDPGQKMKNEETEETAEVEEAKKIVVPGKKVSIPSPHANELKKVKPTIPGK